MKEIGVPSSGLGSATINHAKRSGGIYGPSTAALILSAAGPIAAPGASGARTIKN
jgi:hypothetical protein